MLYDDSPRAGSLGEKFGAESHSSTFQQSWWHQRGLWMPPTDRHLWAMFLSCLGESRGLIACLRAVLHSVPSHCQEVAARLGSALSSHPSYVWPHA